MKLTLIFTFAVLLFIAAAFPAQSQAATIPVSNYSFESPGGNFAVNNNPTVIPDWTVNSPSYYGNQTIVGQFANPGNSQGSAYLFMNLDGPGSATTTSDPVTTIADYTVYKLTVALGNHNQTGAYGDPGDMTISLLANGVVIPGATLTITNGTIPNGYFQDYSVGFTTSLVDPLSGENLTIQLGTASGGQTQASFDDVRLHESEVPEPSTYAMLLAGLAFLGLCVRRNGAVLK
jgi:hypothetical protein